MTSPSEPALLQEILWGPNIGAALWPFQPRGAEYLRPLHLHSQPELFVMRRGSVVLRIGGELYPMQRGQAAWIPPGVQHMVVDFSPGADFWVLQPGPALLQLALAQLQVQPRFGGGANGLFGAGEQPGLAWLAKLSTFLPDPPVFVPKQGDLTDFEAQAELTWRAYLDAQREPVPNPRFNWIPAWSQSRARVARSLLLELVCQGFRMAPAEATQARLARRAFNLILQEPQLSREQLCERLAISESHLSRRFPAIFGSSLVEQRARTRLVAFIALSRPPGVNLLHASLDAGFGSYAQLHRVLTRHSGCGAREYLSGGDLRVASITCSRLGS